MSARDSMEYRISALVFAAAAAAVSAVTFLYSGISGMINTELAEMMSQIGIGTSVSVLIVFLLCLTIPAAMASEKRMKWPISFSWTLYVPSVMGYSKIDWVEIFGGISNPEVTANQLPEAFIPMNGILLICASLFLRSHKNVYETRKNLLERGGDEEEVNEACIKNMKFILPMILGPAALVAIIWSVTKLIPSESLGFADSEMYVWISLVCGIVLMALFVSAFLGREKPETRTDAEHTDGDL